MKTSYLEINQKAIRENLQNIKRKIGDKKILPVIKADGYGTGAEAILPILEKEEIKQIAVATVHEALILRKAGWEDKILILNQLWNEDEEDINGILEADLTVRNFRTSHIRNIKSKSKRKG